MKSLMVIVPGLSDPYSAWQPLLNRLEKETAFSNATWFFWEHGSRRLSRASAETLARTLSAEIEARWQTGGFDDVVLVGFSFGAVLMRQAFLLATGTFPVPQTQAPEGFSQHVRSFPIRGEASLKSGETFSEANVIYDEARDKFAQDPDVFRASGDKLEEHRTAFTDTPESKSWSRHVSRFVMIAGISRGLSAASVSGINSVAVRAIEFLNVPHFLLIQDLLEGSPFITNLRLEWIRYFRNPASPRPVVVQLLGTEDSIVARQDCIDTEQFPNAWHIDVPGATHSNIHHVDSAKDAKTRYQLFFNAMTRAAPATKSLLARLGPRLLSFFYFMGYEPQTRKVGLTTRP